MKNGAWLLSWVALGLPIGGCSGQADRHPSSHGRSDEKLALSAKTADSPEQPVKPATPATIGEVLQTIDLRQLPKLDGAKVQIAKGYELYYSAPGRMADAAALYRNKLSEQIGRAHV